MKLPTLLVAAASLLGGGLCWPDRAVIDSNYASSIEIYAVEVLHNLTGAEITSDSQGCAGVVSDNHGAAPTAALSCAFVGASEATKAAPEFNTGSLSTEGFYLAAVGGDTLLRGGSTDGSTETSMVITGANTSEARGVLYAAFHALELAGWRFLTPEFTVEPSDEASGVEVSSLPQVFEPDFEVRCARVHAAV